MPSMPKPQPCGQNWLAMQPTENGRRCGQCDKVIHDFSRLSWPEIEQRQQAHGNALCGMYSPAQLQHWGQEPPTAPSVCARLTAATTLALILSSLPSLAQISPAKIPNAITIRGTVYENTKGKRQLLPGVTVLLKGTHLGIASDDNGQYELSIPDTVAARAHSTIVLSSIGYASSEFALDSLRLGSSSLLIHDVELKQDGRDLDAFYVQAPTLSRRLWSQLKWWTFTRWFGRGNR